MELFVGRIQNSSPNHKKSYSSFEWFKYFQGNKSNEKKHHWVIGANLSQVEREKLSASLQDFQLGESGEGNHLRECAKKYVESSQDEDYLKALDLFLKEENNHSTTLSLYLHLAKIPTIDKSKLDYLFSSLRHIGGLEFKLMILLCAEFVGKIYYETIYDQSSCQLLKNICNQFVSDEVSHIHFHLSTIDKIRIKNRPIFIKLKQWIQVTLILLTLICVWLKHKKAFVPIYPNLISLLKISFKELKSLI